MPNISKIKDKDTNIVYDIEDTVARNKGLSNDIKQALLTCFQKVAWIDENGETYYNALNAALNPPTNLSSISAVYTQSGTVYSNASLDSLKSDLVVTAHYSDSTTETVNSYVLSGTLTVGTSVITASYGGKTTTFNVTVIEYPYRTLVASDVVSYTGYSGYALNNGNITATSVATFSVLELADTINKFKFTPNKHYTHTEDHYTTVIFAKDINGAYYGTDGSDIYEFTLASGKYNASLVSGFSTLTITGVLNDDTDKSITLENGILTLTGGNGSITLTNANMIGLWGSKPNYMLPLNAEVNA